MYCTALPVHNVFRYLQLYLASNKVCARGVKGYALFFYGAYTTWLVKEVFMKGVCDHGLVWMEVLTLKAVYSVTIDSECGLSFLQVQGGLSYPAPPPPPPL